MRVQIFSFDESRSIIYCPDTLRFFVASKNDAHIAKLLATGYNARQVIHMVRGLDLISCEQLASQLKQGDVSEATSCLHPGGLSRLVLHVSNDCNMRCRYCYAACGSYGTTRSLMDGKTLHRTLDVFYSVFSEIGLLQIFGGEPSLNLAMVREACEYVRYFKKDTHLGMVTNGTCTNDEFVQVIRDFDVDVTVSIDVSEAMTMLRPMSSPEISSASVVHDNVLKMLAKTNQPSQFELTYTEEHVRQGISVTDVLERLHEEYGDVPVHVTPVCAPGSRFELSSAAPFVNAVPLVYSSDCISRGIRPYALVADYAHMLRHHIYSSRICSAGVGTVAVSTQGDIYPCFYFVGNKSFCAANVFDDEERVRRALNRMRSQFDAFAYGRCERCKTCFANTLCHGCMGANYEVTGQITLPGQKQCDITRGIIRELIEVLAHKVVK